MARALLKRPDLLVLSEATSAVDTLEQVDLVERLREAMAGHCIVWSLQRPALARSFDRVVVMQGGRVAQTGTPDEIVNKISAAVKAAAAGDTFVKFGKSTLTEIDYADAMTFMEVLQAENSYFEWLLPTIDFSK